MQSVTSKVELRDVASGLWIWRAEHHHWKPGDDWQPIVTSTYVDSGGERLVIDPLVPKAGAAELWKRLDERPPTMAAVIIPDHVRDIDEFVRRYRVRAFGPRLYWPDDLPENALAARAAGDSLWRWTNGAGRRPSDMGFPVAQEASTAGDARVAEASV